MGRSGGDVASRVLVALVISICVVVTSTSVAIAGGDCGGLDADLDMGEERFLPPRLFTGTVVETSGSAAFVEVEEVGRGPDVAPTAWVAGLGSWEVGSRLPVGSEGGELRTNGCLRDELERDLDHRDGFAVRAPTEGGDAGSEPFAVRAADARPYAIGGVVVLVAIAFALTRRTAAGQA